MNATALLALDLQRDFLDPGGRLPIRAAQQAPLIAAVNRLLAHAEAQGWTVVLVENRFAGATGWETCSAGAPRSRDRPERNWIPE